jgi:hypothetical protein
MSCKRTSFILASEEPLHLGLELGHFFELWHPGDLEQGVPKPGTKALCMVAPGSYSLLSSPVPAPAPVLPADPDEAGTFTSRFLAYSQTNPSHGVALAIIDPDSAPPRRFP